MSPAVRCPRDIPDGPDGSGWIRMDPDGSGWFPDGCRTVKNFLKNYKLIIFNPDGFPDGVRKVRKASGWSRTEPIFRKNSKKIYLKIRMVSGW